MHFDQNMYNNYIIFIVILSLILAHYSSMIL